MSHVLYIPSKWGNYENKLMFDWQAVTKENKEQDDQCDDRGLRRITLFSSPYQYEIDKKIFDNFSTVESHTNKSCKLFFCTLKSVDVIYGDRAQDFESERRGRGAIFEMTILPLKLVMVTRIF